jgi:hypothetical protein
MDEARLLEKLQALEALHAGATTDGERLAAGEARRRIQERLEAQQAEAPPKEYKLTVGDAWSMKLLIALCRRYGIKPYRYSRQRRTTLMIRVSERFLDETLWPEFSELSQVLSEQLGEVTERIIAKAIHDDTSDAGEAEKSEGLLGR